jgi:hypothetical protein
MATSEIELSVAVGTKIATLTRNIPDAGQRSMGNKEGILCFFLHVYLSLWLLDTPCP